MTEVLEYTKYLTSTFRKRGQSSANGNGSHSLVWSHVQQMSMVQTGTTCLKKLKLSAVQGALNYVKQHTRKFENPVSPRAPEDRTKQMFGVSPYQTSFTHIETIWRHVFACVCQDYPIASKQRFDYNVRKLGRRHPECTHTHTHIWCWPPLQQYYWRLSCLLPLDSRVAILTMTACEP
jgi:hypothetical protein